MPSLPEKRLHFTKGIGGCPPYRRIGMITKEDIGGCPPYRRIDGITSEGIGECPPYRRRGAFHGGYR